MTLEVKQETPLEGGKVRKQIADLLYFARGLIVRDDGAFVTITDIYAKARQMERLVSDHLKEANRPYKERMNANTDIAAAFLEPLKEIIAVCNLQTTQYRALLVEQKAKEEAAVKVAAAAVDAPMPYIAPVDRSIRGSGATSITRRKMRFEVTELGKVPLQYMQINAEAVETALKLGVAEIAGIRVWEEVTTELRMR